MPSPACCSFSGGANGGARLRVRWSQRTAQAAVATAGPARHRATGLRVCARAGPWRPTLDDVESISRGGPAKVRGTGSRRIPHRLNAEERDLYDLAKNKGFLAVRGTGYRRFRHGNPLPNIFRQWCDARGQACVVVEKDAQGSRGEDRVVVDLAPLRVRDTSQVEAALLQLATELGVRRVAFDERPADALPFNIIPPDEDEAAGAADAPADAAGSSGADEAASLLIDLQQRLGGAEARGRAGPQGASASSSSASSSSSSSMPAGSSGASAGITSEGPVGTADPSRGGLLEDGTEVQRGVVEKAPAPAAATTLGPPRSPAHHLNTLAIWQIRAQPLFFACDRTTAKAFAAEAVRRVAAATLSAHATAL